MNLPASLCCCLHQRRLHDGDATANPRPEPGGDPGPLQRRAADARHHGGLHHYAQKDLQVCVRRRPGEVRGVDGGVWVCVERIYQGWGGGGQSVERDAGSLEDNSRSEAVKKGTYQCGQLGPAAGQLPPSPHIFALAASLITQSILELLID